MVLAFTPPKEKDHNDFVAIKNALSDHFVHPLNELYQSAHFHRRVQQPGGTCDAFFTTFLTLVKRRNYQLASVEDRLVCDHILVGLWDCKLSEQLCRNPRLTLQEALTHVLQFEDADNKGKVCDSADSSPLAVDATCLRKARPMTATSAPTHMPNKLCLFCGRASLPHTDCPARHASCNFCHKSCHFEGVCLKKKRVGKKLSPKPSACSIELHAVAEERPNAMF